MKRVIRNDFIDKNIIAFQPSRKYFINPPPDTSN